MNIAELSVATFARLDGCRKSSRDPGGGTTPSAPPAQTAPPPARPVPPTRDPNTPGYVTARDLPDGTVPPADADGNFIIGPTHDPAPEMTVQEGVPQGTVYNFTMSSAR
jgi:enterochelin esterase family protein